MVRLSHVLAEAQTIASRRAWPSVSTPINQAQIALLCVEPHDGEKPGRLKYTPRDDLWNDEVLEAPIRRGSRLGLRPPRSGVER